MSRTDTAPVPNLKAIRLSRLLTQKALAALSKVSEFTVQRAECGENMAFSTIAKFAEALEVDHTLLTLAASGVGSDA